MQTLNLITTGALLLGSVIGLHTAGRFFSRRTEIATDFGFVWIGQCVGLFATLLFSLKATAFGASADFSAIWALVLRWTLLLATLLPMLRMGWKLEHDRSFMEAISTHAEEASRLVRELKSDKAGINDRCEHVPHGRVRSY